MHRLQDAGRVARAPTGLTSGAADTPTTFAQATAESAATTSRYLGRFAPSPSGPLHLGSLSTALASYLQAKAAGGEWLVRIDDLDPERSRAAAADEIRRTLEACGLHWDREIVFQSRNVELYAAALKQLQDASLLFPCICSRKELANADVYPGNCRHKSAAAGGISYALRLKTEAVTVVFPDRLQGRYTQDLAAEVGDFVIRRRDGVIAYHLATVLDDHHAGVTEVVRGLDLLSSTPRQMYLQQLLQLSQPAYCHVPVLVGADGKKLSKSTCATAVDRKQPGMTLWRLLVWLAQEPPSALAHEPVPAILAWGVANWNTDRLHGKTLIPVTASVATEADPPPSG